MEAEASPAPMKGVATGQDQARVFCNLRTSTQVGVQSSSALTIIMVSGS